MTGYHEEAVLFKCAEEQLVGVVSLPAEPKNNHREAPTTGMIIVVGGPQYRAGSHRQFALLARAVATAGTPVLRFDYRGMGDSTGTLHTFENVTDDIAAAIDALQTTAPTIKKIALWGLCDGASAALLYCHATQDARIAGLCLLNPWVRSDASLAKTQVKHYYTQRLRQKEFWLKLLSGKVAAGAVSGLVRNIKTAFGARPDNATAASSEPFQTRMALGLKQFKGQVLLILSGDDYTAKEFLEYTRAETAWVGLLDLNRLTRFDVPEADHTFSDILGQKLAEARTAEWVQSMEKK